MTVVDDQSPSISCPAAVSVNADAGQCFATGVALGSPLTADNCAVANVTNNAPATFPLGTNTVTWTVTDVHGNSNTCAQTVVIVDNQPPAITCPANVNVAADAGQCFASGVALGSPVTSDNCGVATISNDAPTQFAVGPTLVNWTVTDVNGNTNSCQQTVTVADNQLPSITCPAAVAVNADAGRALRVRCRARLAGDRRQLRRRHRRQ